MRKKITLVNVWTPFCRNETMEHVLIRNSNKNITKWIAATENSDLQNGRQSSTQTITISFTKSWISKTDFAMKWKTQGTPAKNIQKRSRQRQTTSKAEMPENYEKVQQHSKRLKHVGVKWQPQDANGNSQLEKRCSSSTLNQFHRLPIDLVYS